MTLPAPAARMRALVVEDEPTSALLSRHVLEQEGFAVDQANTGADAIRLVLETDYDVIILDLGLPDLNGLQVMEAIRREGRTTPVLILEQHQVGLQFPIQVRVAAARSQRVQQPETRATAPRNHRDHASPASSLSTSDERRRHLSVCCASAFVPAAVIA